MEKTGGYEQINRDLVKALKSIHLGEAAESLGLEATASGHLEIPFLGRTYLLNRDGVHRQGGQEAGLAQGSVLAGYVLKGGRGEVTGRFASLERLFGLTPSRDSYVGNRLESRLARKADLNPARFQEILEKWGGRPGEPAGSGAKSWIVDLLPKIPVQVIFYPGDEEFPGEIRLLFDWITPNFLEFEFMAVLATLFVDEILRQMEVH